MKTPKKFDVVVGNPPYLQGLHLKFLNLAIDVSERYVVWIHPSSWILDKKGLDKRNIQIKEKLNGILKEAIVFNGNKDFDIGLTMPLIIDVIDKEYNSSSVSVLDKINNKRVIYDSLYDFNIWSDNNIYPVLEEKIIEKSNEDNFLNHLKKGFRKISSGTKGEKTLREKIPGAGEDGNYFLNLSELVGHAVKDNSSRMHKDDFYAFFYKTEKIQKTVNKLIYIPFDTSEEAQNAMDYLKTKFARFCLAILKKEGQINRGELKYVPWLDFSKSWPSSKIYEYFNLSREEIDFIETNIPDYY